MQIRNGSRTVIKSTVDSKYIMLVENGICEVPGGGLEVTENPTEAAIREVYEETTLDLLPEELTFIDKITYRCKLLPDMYFSGYLFKAVVNFKFEDVKTEYPGILLVVSKEVLLAHVQYLQCFAGKI